MTTPLQQPFDELIEVGMVFTQRDADDSVRELLAAMLKVIDEQAARIDAMEERLKELENGSGDSWIE